MQNLAEGKGLTMGPASLRYAEEEQQSDDEAVNDRVCEDDGANEYESKGTAQGSHLEQPLNVHLPFEQGYWREQMTRIQTTSKPEGRRYNAAQTISPTWSPKNLDC